MNEAPRLRGAGDLLNFFFLAPRCGELDPGEIKHV